MNCKWSGNRLTIFLSLKKHCIPSILSELFFLSCFFIQYFALVLRFKFEIRIFIGMEHRMKPILG